MTKLCKWEGCNKEIEEWQNYCPQHYAEMLRKKKEEQEKSEQKPDEEPEEELEEKVPEVPEPKKRAEEEVEEIKVTEKEDEEKDFEMKFMEDLSASEKLHVRSVSLQSAVKIICSTDVEKKKYNQLLGEIETLTNELSRIILIDYDY